MTCKAHRIPRNDRLTFTMRSAEGWRPLRRCCYECGAVLDTIRQRLVSLKMPCALEELDTVVRQLEAGQISALEAIEALLSVELSFREARRIKVTLGTSKLMPPKTLESFDFAFQPSLDRDRIYALAALDFIERGEIVHLLSP